MTEKRIYWIMLLLITGSLSACLDNSRKEMDFAQAIGQYRCNCALGQADLSPPYTLFVDSTYMRDIQLTESSELNGTLAVDGVTCDVNCYHIRTDSTYIIRYDAPNRRYLMTVYTLLDSLVESDIYPGSTSTICNGRKL